MSGCEQFLAGIQRVEAQWGWTEAVGQGNHHTNRVGTPREVLEWPYTTAPLDPPSPDQSDHHGKKRKFTVGKILSGHFWYTNC